jgi:hypothetical protein
MRLSPYVLFCNTRKPPDPLLHIPSPAGDEWEWLREGAIDTSICWVGTRPRGQVGRRTTLSKKNELLRVSADGDARCQLHSSIQDEVSTLPTPTQSRYQYAVNTHRIRNECVLIASLKALPDLVLCGKTAVPLTFVPSFCLTFAELESCMLRHELFCYSEDGSKR